MKMIKILVSALTIAAVASAFAQAKPGTPPGPKAGPQQHNKMRGMMGNPELQKKLAITPAQKKKLEALAAGLRDKFQKMKPEERRTKGRDIMMKYRKDVEAVLTAKQKATLAQWRKDHPMRPGARPGSPGGKPGGAPGKKGGN